MSGRIERALLLCRLRSVRTIGVCAAMMLFTQGCLPTPIYKTIQRGQSFLVLDEQGMPISNATVIYMSRSYQMGEKNREIARTDDDGRVKFESLREWHVEAPLMMHGSEQYIWTWCVAATGFETNSAYKESPSSEIVVRLRSGEMKPCPGPDGPDVKIRIR